jgi:hypothetical protein
MIGYEWCNSGVPTSPIILFLYDLFNDVVNSSNYIILNCRVKAENDLERILEEVFMI